MEKNINEAPFPVILHRVLHLMKQQTVPRFREVGLKPGSAAILFSLEECGAMSQRELAEHVGITPPSMTVALKKMEHKGYISRRVDEKDQRIIRIELQEKGVKCVALVKQSITKMEETLFEGFALEEKLLFRRFLLQMHDNLMRVTDWDESEFADCFQHIDRRRELQDEEII